MDLLLVLQVLGRRGGAQGITAHKEALGGEQKADWGRLLSDYSAKRWQPR